MCVYVNCHLVFVPQLRKTNVSWMLTRPWSITNLWVYIIAVIQSIALLPAPRRRRLLSHYCTKTRWRESHSFFCGFSFLLIKFIIDVARRRRRWQRNITTQQPTDVPWLTHCIYCTSYHPILFRTTYYRRIARLHLKFPPFFKSPLGCDPLRLKVLHLPISKNVYLYQVSWCNPNSRSKANNLLPVVYYESIIITISHTSSASFSYWRFGVN